MAESRDPDHMAGHMAGDITVRDAATADDAAVAAIDERSWSPASSPAQHPVRPQVPDTASGRTFLVAERGGRVVGFLVYGPSTPLASNAHVWQVHGLAVDPDHWRRGVATALLDAFAARATARGIRKLTLRVLSTNHAARCLYAGRGYVVEGVLVGEFLIEGREVDDVLMARRLA
jgi:ribosomal protein S18 acetylase RimI-like enzyme